MCLCVCIYRYGTTFGALLRHNSSSDALDNDDNARYAYVHTSINESWHTCEWVMAHTWMSHVTPMNESCHTHLPFATPLTMTTTLDMRMYTLLSMSHAALIWVSHVTHICMRHVTYIPDNDNNARYAYVHTYINESCHAYEWVMSHIWMSHVTYISDNNDNARYAYVHT